MKCKRTEIKIEDANVVTYLRLIVDGEGVRQGIEKLRKKWSGEEYFSAKGWFAPTNNKKIEEFDEDILSLLSKNKLPVTLRYAFSQAIMLGEINSFNMVELVLIHRNLLKKIVCSGPSSDREISDYEYALVFRPEAKNEQMEEAFRNFQNEVKSPKGKPGPFDLRQPITDTKPKVEKQSRWYWKNLPTEEGGEDKSPLDIAKEEIPTEDRTTEDRDIVDSIISLSNLISKEIEDYKKLLLKL